jgi:carbon monoxide dehydrogenase subunit G
VRLDNEFVVAAPLDRTWKTLLDLERVAGCLPGAQLESSGGDGSYRGGMKVKLGPMVVSYDGVARLLDVDEDDHTTTLEVQGKESKGQGTAAATIRNRLEPAGPGSTRVFVETELLVTGRQAQFGRGIMEDVAGRMLGDFAKRLEQLVLADDSGGAGATPAQQLASVGDEPAPPREAPPRAQADDVLDLGGVALGSLRRYAPAGGGLLMVVLALLLLRGRGRRRLVIKVDLSA